MSGSKFNYTDALRTLCFDICSKIREFRNVDVSQIGFSLSLARNTSSRYGNWASVTPLRFENGSPVVVRMRRVPVLENGVRIFATQRLYFRAPPVVLNDGRPALYVFNVMAPRFVNLSVIEKLDTVMHELYHIDPNFNGAARRFPGRNWQHGNMKAYEAKAAGFRKEWLGLEPDPRLFDFLRYSMNDFRMMNVQLCGFRFSKIPLVRISEREAFQLDPSLSLR